MSENKGQFTIFDIIKSLSYSMDLISNTIVGHHKKVAYIVLHLGRSMELAPPNMRKLVIAALIHDLGVFYLHQDFSDLSFDTNDNRHAEIGYQLLEGIFPVEDVPSVIRYHHHSWSEDHDRDTTILSHLLCLADRIAVLIKDSPAILDQKDRILETIQRYSGTHFYPAAVEHFSDIAEKEYFWLDVISNPRIEESVDTFFSSYTWNNLNYEELLNIGHLISRIIDFRSPFTATHSCGVSDISTYLGAYCKFTKEEQKELQIAGYLHDIGKLVVPPHILNKTGALSSHEWNIMKTHTYYTYQALSASEELRTIRQWAAYHHEKLNGEGYPFHLDAKELTLGSRILSVADTFTAITEHRPYRKGMQANKVKDILHSSIRSDEMDEEVAGIVMERFDEFHELRADSQQRAENYFDTFEKNILKSLKR